MDVTRAFPHGGGKGRLRSQAGTDEGGACHAVGVSTPVNPQQPRQLAPKAAQTTRENPWPLRLLTRNIRSYVDRMSELWIEGQVVEYRPRPGTKMAFFVLRDTDEDTSMTVTAFASVMDRSGPGFEEGARVVVRAKPVFWERRGTLNLRADEIHLMGVGDLLAHIEQVRRRLASEGLFAAERKVALPFLPRVIGLICGRNAKAKDDVLANAQARWPGCRFEIREVAVQGDQTVAQVSRAMRELDAMPGVDVIVVTRGGGSVEDLLPFSEEALVRAAAEVRTPLVSAIGHEADAPLLDLVADYRASTPTDAARRIVPDRAQELRGLSHATGQLRHAMGARLAREREALSLVASRPVLQSPTGVIAQHLATVDALSLRLSSAIGTRLSTESAGLSRAEATLRAVSPQATLDRGYALLRTPSGDLLRDAATVKKGDLIEGVLAKGRLVAQVVGSVPADTPTSD